MNCAEVSVTTKARERGFPKGAATAQTPSTAEGRWRETLVRWLKFNAVGGLGIAVQFAALLALKSGFHLNYLLATALAVEVTVVHNFLWHERYTWSDRSQPSSRTSMPRLLRFNLSTGAVSIAGNLVLMKVLVGLADLNFLFANCVAIILCSLVNFLVSDRFVFSHEVRPQSPPSSIP